MFMLFTLTVFAILMLISLDATTATAARLPRCLARRAMGLTSLGLGALLAAGILTSHLPDLCGTAVAWAAPNALGPRASADGVAADESAATAATPQAEDGSPATVQPAATEERVDAKDVASEPSDDESQATATSSPRSSPGSDRTPLTLGSADDLPRVVIPYESRPAWVDSLPDLSGDVHRIAISAGPFDRKSDCLQELDNEKVAAINRYINDYLGNPRASLFVHYDLDTINRRLLAPGNVHEETIEVSLGPMHQVHALLEIDPQFRSELDSAWRDVLAGTRLGQTGLAAFGVLALLGVMFTYFKLDTATRGYYSTKLQMLAALAILALIGAGVLMSGWIPRL
jgi:hypothetical protein